MLSLLVILSLGSSDFDRYEVTETHRIRLRNEAGAPVEVSPDRGQHWLAIGRVTRAARSVAEGYAATRWSRDGTVCATAVHGLRIRVGPNPSGDRGLVIAVVPREFASPSPGFGGFTAGTAGIYTDIRAGTSLFRNLAPYVGNPVYLERGPSLLPLPIGYIPSAGDRLVVVVERPVRMPSALQFENRVGGTVTVQFADGERLLIGRVTRAAKGVGRFDATGYTGVGCINTNHSGVITISTAPDVNGEPLFDDPFGETRGGFMIQPSIHAANESEAEAQAMVVAPVHQGDPPLEGRPPLFAGFLGLEFQSRDPAASFYCAMRVDDGPWEPLPEYTGRDDSLLTAGGLARYFRSRGVARPVRRGVTAFRITFPQRAGAAASAVAEARSDGHLALLWGVDG